MEVHYHYFILKLIPEKWESTDTGRDRMRVIATPKFKIFSARSAGVGFESKKFANLEKTLHRVWLAKLVSLGSYADHVRKHFGVPPFMVLFNEMQRKSLTGAGDWITEVGPG